MPQMYPSKYHEGESEKEENEIICTLRKKKTTNEAESSLCVDLTTRGSLTSLKDTSQIKKR